MVPQPDLQGATAHMSAEAVQDRLEKKAEELKNDESLSQVGERPVCVCASTDLPCHRRSARRD